MNKAVKYTRLAFIANQMQQMKSWKSIQRYLCNSGHAMKNVPRKSMMMETPAPLNKKYGCT